MAPDYISGAHPRLTDLDPLEPGVDVNLSPRKKPMRVMPNRLATSTARLLGRGDRAHDGHAGVEALLQDLVAAPPADQDDVLGERHLPSRSAQPNSLSVALWRPTSSRSATRFPFRVEERRGVQPARRLEEPWASRSFSGSE
jgi:hypothetical protein